MRPADLDLTRAARLATEIAVAAGSTLRDGHRNGLASWTKGDHGDVVTELDLAAERLIVRRLQAAFPRHRILAEESGVHSASGDGDDDQPTWLVDPLDGTNNVAIGLAAYVVGIALCVRRRPVVSVIHDPVSGLSWSAQSGAGASGPSGRLAPVHRPTPHGPVLAWTQGHQVSRSDPTALALKVGLDLHARRQIQLWAPLLCWAMLARGDIDGFIGYLPESVDLPGGVLLAAEAGLELRNLDGGPFDDALVGRPCAGFIAAHPDRIAELVTVVAAARADPFHQLRAVHPEPIRSGHELALNRSMPVRQP